MFSSDFKKILEYPNLILSQVSEEIKQSFFNNPELIRFIEEMRIIKDSNGGLGLAAIQIGVPRRIIIVDQIVMINPKIIKSENEIEVEESCLSIKNQVFKKKRFNKVKIEYKDIHGKRHTSTMIGSNAHCVQHEIDHLNGILINM